MRVWEELFYISPLVITWQTNQYWCNPDAFAAVAPVEKKRSKVDRSVFLTYYYWVDSKESYSLFELPNLVSLSLS